MTNRLEKSSWRVRMLLCGASLVCLFVFTVAGAQLKDYKTIVTFSNPVEVPGSTPQVLPAGTYMFKVVDSKVNRNIVQISNKDETHVFTTVQSVPAHRDEETDKTVILFKEKAAGDPQPLRMWFYPYEKQGQEFVYPKARAQELANLSNTPVPYSDGTTTGVADPDSGSSSGNSSATSSIQSPIGATAPAKR